MTYVRDPVAVSKNFAVNSAKQVVCKAACTIQVPKTYFDGNLGILGVDTKIYGLFPVILGTGQFSLVNTAAMFSIAPTSTTVITVDEVEYYEFTFAKDTVIFKTTGLLSDAKLIYEVFQAFYFMGKVPWYVGYEDHGKLLDSAIKFAGFGAVKNPEVVELLTSMVARKRGDMNNEFLRLAISDYSQTEIGKVDFVPMGSVIASVRSSLGKISGAHGQDGIVSAIVTPATEVGTVEKIVRA